MIAANALLAKNPWNRLRPSLVQSGFAKEMRRRSDLPDNVLEVRRDPRPDATQPFGFGYASLTTLTATDFATPLAVPTARVPVADLLPY